MSSDLLVLFPPEFPVIAFAFLITAILYSTAGFGGGSTYSAILLQASLPVAMIPLISLPCNIVVSGTGFLRMARRGLVPGRTLLSMVAVSMPAAFLGGAIPVSRELFFFLLAIVLLNAGVLNIVRGAGIAGRYRENEFDDAHAALYERVPTTIGPTVLAASALIGLVSGVVGIGGGILLSPILQRDRSISPRRVSALSSGFIVLNSVAGLTARMLVAAGDLFAVHVIIPILALSAIVLVGGFIGSGVAVRGLTAGRLRVITGALLVVVALRVLV